jgi:hypothetical protein
VFHSSRVRVPYHLKTFLRFAFWFSCIPQVPASAAARDASEVASQGLRESETGFSTRVSQAFESQRGKPLARAKKEPPLGPGRGQYVRGYSFSLVEFATRCFRLNEQVPEANAALLENARHYLENPADLEDRDNFHWHSEMLLRLVEMYGTHGREAAGRMIPEAENEILEVVWQYVRRVSKLADADAHRSQTWEVHESENHHLQIVTTLWHFAQIARDRPGYREMKYEDGFRAEEHYGAWTNYLKAYCLERARKGLFIETGSDNYNGVAIKGLYNMFDFAKDPELVRRAGLLLDLFWACWAEAQLDGVRGGGRARIYPGNDSLSGRGSHIARLAWFYFGLGQPPKSVLCPMLSALTSGWKPAQVVANLAQDPAARGSYAIRQRIQGLAVPGFHTLPVYHLRTDQGGVLNYAWCTPGFMLGSLIFEARPHWDWAGISSQNRWQGVIFAGDPDARIVPQVHAESGKAVYNAHWSVQEKGALITQKLKTNRFGKSMRVWFSESGLSARREEAGWFFVTAPGAYAAVRPVTGGTAWEPDPAGRLRGSWMICENEWTPVILEVAGKMEWPSEEAFQKAVTKLPVRHEAGVVNYQSLAGDTFRFWLDQSRAPEVNGKPVDLTPRMAFDSPFVRGDWNSGIVTVSFRDQRLVLNFNSPPEESPAAQD